MIPALTKEAQAFLNMGYMVTSPELEGCFLIIFKNFRVKDMPSVKKKEPEHGRVGLLVFG
jgi:hypothetical protein